MANKMCVVCFKSLPLVAFHMQSALKDGRRNQCKACDFAYQAARRLSKKAEISASRRKYYADNREHVRQVAKAWTSANPGRINAQNRKIKAAKKKRTPKWLSKAQLAEMTDFYIEAKDFQWLSLEQLQVDHIVPLNGENVSGLHVPWNLQILPKTLNLKKSNKLGASGGK